MSRSISTSGARTLALAGAAALAGACSSAANPVAPQGSRSATPTLPAFVYVSDAAGTPQLYRYGTSGSVRLTFDNSTDDHPYSAAGRVVFTSYRDNDPEIYIADNDGTSLQRLTRSNGLDDEAKLDPTGTHIVFVSDRGGVMRLFTMDASGAHQTALQTGSESWVPERAPAWNPSSTQLAFTSTRTGISQVFIVPAAGGNAVQVSHEAGGAFDPTWSADGTQIVFVSASGTPYLREWGAATGLTTDFEHDSTSLGQPACAASLCLAVSGAYGASGRIVAYSTTRGAPVTLVASAGFNETSPAFIVP